MRRVAKCPEADPEYGFGIAEALRIVVSDLRER